MRVIIQRVLRGSVSVGGKQISSINRGLVVLVGIKAGDTEKDAQWICNKLLKARLWPKDNKEWNISLQDQKYEILLVSQFTLYAVFKGLKPDFHNAMPPNEAKLFYNNFVDLVKKNYEPSLVKDGEFGAMMEVEIINDGPVSLTLDSPS
uniref:D-aminoacyl-tRNA deacylase n=1 Tax=Arcella intermedia TaxID=1963864 RepID=A0A6B2LP59_9EUKA|eukprot:TRINITY_DN23449_c0_g1_i1.p1 TRINITY_DN23449_c0_g1~~TRINITY_DN23449_c0_g1_i1.p1  ORF type:complete len:173 (+),score=38.22 TRINITY_DN23449_c0_g1_i1:75-521(+)